MQYRAAGIASSRPSGIGLAADLADPVGAGVEAVERRLQLGQLAVDALEHAEVELALERLGGLLGGVLVGARELALGGLVGGGAQPGGGVAHLDEAVALRVEPLAGLFGVHGFSWDGSGRGGATLSSLGPAGAT